MWCIFCYNLNLKVQWKTIVDYSKRDLVIIASKLVCFKITLTISLIVHGHNPLLIKAEIPQKDIGIPSPTAFFFLASHLTQFSYKKKEINSNYAKISLELHNLVKEAINRLKCKTIPNKFRHDHKKDSLPFSQKHFFPIHIHCACIVWEKGKKEFSSIFRFIFCNYDFATIFFYLKDGSLRLIFRENSKI